MKNTLAKLSIAALTFITPINSFADFVKNSEIVNNFINQKTVKINALTNQKDFEKIKKEINELEIALREYKKILNEFNSKYYEIIKHSDSLNMGIKLGNFAYTINQLKKQLNNLKKKSSFKKHKKEFINNLTNLEKEIKTTEKYIQHYIDITGYMINARGIFNILQKIIKPPFNHTFFTKEQISLLSNLRIKDFWFSIGPEENKTLFISIEANNIEKINFKDFLELETNFNKLLLISKESYKIFEEIFQNLASKNPTPYDFSKVFEFRFQRISLI
jgi:hypothetical protein